MSVEANEAVVRRWVEMQNQGDLSALEEVLSPAHAQVFREGNAVWQTGFPGYQQIIEDMISDGDKVVSRITIQGVHRGEFADIAPTGKKVRYSLIAIDRLEDGKVVESWEQGAYLDLMSQLGATVVPGQGGD